MQYTPTAQRDKLSILFLTVSTNVNLKHLCPYNLTYPQNSLTIFCTDSKQLLSNLYGKEYPCNYLKTLWLTLTGTSGFQKHPRYANEWLEILYPKISPSPSPPLSIRILMPSLYLRPTKILLCKISDPKQGIRYPIPTLNCHKEIIPNCPTLIWKEKLILTFVSVMT